MTVEILSTATADLFSQAVKRVSERLRAGDIVALPTETVYGLAANAYDEKAVGRIYQAKGRPATNPIIVHVSGVAMARRCVSVWPEAAGKLARAFWPGPLTMVLPRARTIPDIVTNGGPTVGVRWPSHPFILAVIRECGFPLAAPSANLSNRVSPTKAGHVIDQLGKRIRLLVDGGPCQVGIESTVLDLSAQPPRVLRPGMIHDEALSAVIGRLGVRRRDGGRRGAMTLRSPGLSSKHYAPKARLVLWRWRDDAELTSKLAAISPPPAHACLIAHSRVPSVEGLARVSVIPREARTFARALYAELHACDEAGADLIIAERPPRTAEWKGIADRLKRAAA